MTKREHLMRRLKGGWDALAVRDGVLEAALSKEEKLVLLSLVSHANERRIAGAERGLSVRRVALLSSVHKDTPGKIFARLEQAGLFLVLRDPRERHADRFDLAGLPAALAALLSGPEGQALSGAKGQAEASEPIPGCPSATALAVPREQPSLSYTEGTKQSLEAIKEATSTSPRRRAAPPGPVREAPKLMGKTASKSKKRERTRTRTDADVACHGAILEAYSAAVLAKTGSAPSIESREAASAWKLLDWCKGDGARAVALVRGAVGRDFGGSTSLNVIASDPNKYLGAAKAITRPSGPKQPNAGIYRPPTEHLS